MASTTTPVSSAPHSSITPGWVSTSRMLVSPALKETIKSHAILKDARDWERGSDHVPVLATLNV